METDFTKTRWLKDVDKTFLNKLRIIYYFGNLAFMITEDDDCFSIGKNDNGMLGIGSDEPKEVLTPKKITSLCQKRITNFSCGGWHVVAFTDDGKLYTWGYNEYGQLGLGHKDDSSSPVVVKGSLSGKNIIQAACGDFHTLVLTSDGKVFGTGDNLSGELGIDSTTNQSSFVQIKDRIGTSKIIQISCGRHHSAAVSSAGEIFLWGRNQYGQVGTGNKNNQFVPLKLNFQHPIKKVGLGNWHTLALTTNGILYAWGSNRSGQLDINHNSECLREPIQIWKELGVITDVLAFRNLSCCKTDANAYVWGECNVNDQLSPKASQFTDLMQAALDAEVGYHYQPIIICKKKLHVDLGREISNSSTHDATFVTEDSQDSTEYTDVGQQLHQVETQNTDATQNCLSENSSNQELSMPLLQVQADFPLSAGDISPNLRDSNNACNYSQAGQDSTLDLTASSNETTSTSEATKDLTLELAASSAEFKETASTLDSILSKFHPSSTVGPEMRKKLHVDLGRGISNASSHGATFVAEDSQDSTENADVGQQLHQVETQNTNTTQNCLSENSSNQELSMPLLQVQADFPLSAGDISPNLRDSNNACNYSQGQDSTLDLTASSADINETISTLANVGEIVDILLTDGPLISNWKRLSDRLKLTPAETDQLNLSYRNGTITAFELFYSIIKIWISKTTSTDRSVSAFCEILKNLDYVAVSELILKKFDPSSTIGMSVVPKSFVQKNQRPTTIMSSEMFETLEEELQNLCDMVESRIENKLVGAPYGESRKKLVKEIKKDLSKGQNLVQQLESEARLAPAPYRHELTAKLRTHRENVAKLNNRYRNVLANFGDRKNHKPDARRTVLEGQKLLDRTGDTIARSTYGAIETEQIGAEVIGELGTQRETLVRTNGRLVDTDVEISRSRQILRSMYMNIIYNKLILIGIIIIEVIVLAFVVYWKYVK